MGAGGVVTAGTQPIGIDLGTTYSVVATVDAEGRPTVLRNDLDEETVPSVVHFESASCVLVGSAANNATAVAPDHTVALIKRQMGTDRLLEFSGVEYTPESISSLILRALVQGVANARGYRPPPPGVPVPAVVTVPAYFGIREREATQQACLLAGIDVLELVSEPVAAAIHYGLSDSPGQGLALVYDLGGGTFDATLLEIGAQISVLATDGDAELGGADWDERLVAHLMDRFEEVAGSQDDPTDDPSFLPTLRQMAERLKRDLSRVTSRQVPIRQAGRTVTVTVTRTEFEAMTRDLVETTLAAVRRLLQHAGRVPAEVRHVLMVGGSSRMPMVSAALVAEFGWQPRLYDPDLAVAKGAALRAHHLRPPVSAAGGPGIRAVQSRAATASVVARGLGLLIEDSNDPTANRTFVQHVIHQNERLPIVGRQAELATILPGQGRMKIAVYEQAGSVSSPEAEHNRPALEGELSGLPDRLPAGSRIVVSLSLGLDGRLEVTATEPRSGVTLRLEAFVEGVIDAEARRQAAGRLNSITVRQ
ncbi:molecular chaperone DnaK (HSP70) [Allocatelliglobosispora scoriae]|uniref:Molecular chaperone DnaK (HSP70) n=1 Tax=Allocatelliglobosispora scoriae TaxID=643052 RepID=A0A841BV50_9ACTN|nr:Hsp70 family protein [Allocatelliglobosispora scoriae]MBB5872977.1 molecular chaperone DnaK (HSP70) [Allocatelliglobosispora scoriae]